MWFVSRVADYHAAGDAGNKAAFAGLLDTSEVPVGLLAYSDDGDPIGWCAAGPRSRYSRAVKAPNGGGRRSDRRVSALRLKDEIRRAPTS